MEVSRRMMMLGAVAVASCASTPRTVPLSQAVSAKGLEAVGAFDAVFQLLEDSPERFRELSCRHQIVNHCTSSNALARLGRLSHAQTCPSSDRERDAQRAYVQRIGQMRQALAPMRRAYTEFGALAGINATQDLSTASQSIANSLNQAAAAIGKAPIATDRQVSGISGLIGMAGAEWQARQLRRHNENFAAFYETAQNWWTEESTQAVIGAPAGDPSLFSMGDVPLRCIAPTPLSDAFPYSDEMVRRSERRRQIVVSEERVVDTYEAKIAAVNSALAQCARAHRALAEDRLSLGEFLNRMTGAVDLLVSIVRT